MTSFREVVTAAVREQFHDDFLVDPVPLAEAIHRHLKLAGYSIHRSGECVHPHSRRQDLGREMTPEEVERYGV